MGFVGVVVRLRVSIVLLRFVSYLFMLDLTLFCQVVSPCSQTTTEPGSAALLLAAVACFACFWLLLGGRLTTVYRIKAR